MIYNKLKEVKKELEDLRGKKVDIFGQLYELPKESDLYIDIMEVLENIENNVLDNDYFNSLNLENKEIWEIIETLKERDIIYNYKADNSYNWGGYLNNDIQYYICNLFNNEVLVFLSIHKFGDIRGNYTDYILLEYEDEEDFLEDISIFKTESIDIDNQEFFYCYNSISEEIEIEDINGNLFYCYCLDDIEDTIKDYLNNKEV